MTDSIPRITGDKSYRLEVAGERNYLANFERIFGKRDDDGIDENVDVLLVLEPNNPYDPNAVRVEIDGLTLGYLTRHSAPAFRAMLRSRYGAVDRAYAAGVVRGGWDRGHGDTGDFGVTLDVPLDAQSSQVPAAVPSSTMKPTAATKSAPLVQPQSKKPWYRRWWVWVIILIFFLGLCMMFSTPPA